MKKLNDRGFTLIELLAVITIMAVLLIVGIPAISKIIYNSRKDVAENSVKSYANETNKEIKSREMSELDVEDGLYSIMKNGNICLAGYDRDTDSCSGEVLIIEMDGNVPSDGQVEIANQKVVSVYNAKVGNFYVNGKKDGSYIASSTPVEIKNTLCQSEGSVSYEIGTLYTCEVAPNVKHDFRILGSSGDVYYLLMTKNLEGINTNWFNFEENGRNYNQCGPVRAYEALTNATKGWTNLQNVTYTHNQGPIKIAFDADKDQYLVYSSEPDCFGFSLTADVMKARMASYDELFSLSDEWYRENIGNGYWLNDIIDEDYAFVYAIGGSHGNTSEAMWVHGVRPVIYVNKGDLS